MEPLKQYITLLSQTKLKRLFNKIVKLYVEWGGGASWSAGNSFTAKGCMHQPKFILRTAENGFSLQKAWNGPKCVNPLPLWEGATPSCPQLPPKFTVPLGSSLVGRPSWTTTVLAKRGKVVTKYNAAHTWQHSIHVWLLGHFGCSSPSAKKLHGPTHWGRIDFRVLTVEPLLTVVGRWRLIWGVLFKKYFCFLPFKRSSIFWLKILFWQ